MTIKAEDIASLMRRLKDPPCIACGQPASIAVREMIEQPPLDKWARFKPGAIQWYCGKCAEIHANQT